MRILKLVISVFIFCLFGGRCLFAQEFEAKYSVYSRPSQGGFPGMFNFDDGIIYSVREGLYFRSHELGINSVVSISSQKCFNHTRKATTGLGRDLVAKFGKQLPSKITVCVAGTEKNGIINLNVVRKESNRYAGGANFTTTGNSNLIVSVKGERCTVKLMKASTSTVSNQSKKASLVKWKDYQNSCDVTKRRN